MAFFTPEPTSEKVSSWLIWNDGTVLKLAQTIHEGRFDLFPMLADAFEDAGCGYADIMTHCRGDFFHAQNCPVLNLVRYHGQDNQLNSQPQSLCCLPNLNWLKVYQALDMSKEYFSDIPGLFIIDSSSLWTIPVIKGVTCNRVVAVLHRNKVQVCSYKNDLDQSLWFNIRNPFERGSYDVSFKRTVEADPKNLGESADVRKSKGCNDITLLERLLLELGFYLTTGQSLDIGFGNSTLCSGSRFSDNDNTVPVVHCSNNPRKIHISFWHPIIPCPSMRARSVVSLS